MLKIDQSVRDRNSSIGPRIAGATRLWQGSSYTSVVHECPALKSKMQSVVGMRYLVGHLSRTVSGEQCTSLQHILMRCCTTEEPYLGTPEASHDAESLTSPMLTLTRYHWDASRLCRWYKQKTAVRCLKDWALGWFVGSFRTLNPKL